jgi:tetratricopeptide (TPR) repeat protein
VELREAIALAYSSPRPLLRLVLEEQTPAQPQLSEAVPEFANLIQSLLGTAVAVAPQVNEALATLAQSLLSPQNPNAPQEASPFPFPFEHPPHGPHGGNRGHGGCGRGFANRKQAEELANEGLALMDANDYVAAKAKFEEQLSLIRRPWHRSTPLYNIACCNALLGEPEAAFSFLEQAIECGYRDVEHIKVDEDFASIRDSDKFRSLIEKASEPVAPRCPGAWGPGAFGRCGQNKPRQQWFELQQQALSLMQTKDAEKIKEARELLDKQVALSPHPWGKRIPLYNIACCEALLGNSDVALKFLQEAIDCGYRNVKHIEGDHDLDSLRELEGYKQIISSIKSGHRCRGWWRFGAEQPEEEQPTEQQQTVEEPAAQPVEPQQPVEVPSEEPAVEQPVAQPTVVLIPEEFEYLKPQIEVLQQMGFVEIQQNLKALLSSKGDIAKAIEKLLK